MNYTITQVAQAGRMTKRNAQFFTHEGVFVPQAGTEGRGPGKPRLFDALECEVVSPVVGVLSRYSIQVGHLRSVAGVLRSACETGRRLDISGWVDAEEIAHASGLRSLLAKNPDDEILSREFAKVRVRPLDLNPDELRDLTWFGMICKARDGDAKVWLSLAVNDDEWKLTFNERSPSDRFDGAEVTDFIAINLTKTLRSVRGNF